MTISSALTRVSAPIISQGGAGAWDEWKIGPLAILRMGAGDYRMWYEGIDNDAGNPGDTKIGYATSSDGLSWSKYGSNPIFSFSSAWENNEVSPDTVIWDSGASIFKMWYHGGHNVGPRQIGYATSSDGIAWTRDAGNPILTVGGAGQWDDEDVADCAVIRMASNDYRMWYKGNGGALPQPIGYATSTDGISWSKSGSNPVFTVGSGGQWDEHDIMGSDVLKLPNDPRFHLFYSANRNTDFVAGLGYASSNDGITWTRGASNPILSDIAEEKLDDPPFVYSDLGLLRVVYAYTSSDFSTIQTQGEARGRLELDPITFSVAASGDDGDVAAGGASWPPPDTPVAATIPATITVRKCSVVFDEVIVGLMRFDTSLIPDNAVVIAATLQVYVTAKADQDNRSLQGEWFDNANWPISSGDYALDVGTNAIFSVDITGISTGQVVDFTLANPGNVNKTGYTGLRLGISGGKPAVFDNRIVIASYDDATLQEPRLIVTFTEALPPGFAKFPKAKLARV